MPKNTAVQKTHEYLRQAEGFYHRSFELSEIRFDLKGKTAGSVRLGRKGESLIRYNLQLLEENQHDFLQRTVPHEVAHLVAYQVHGHRIRPHGPQWKAVMALFGADDSRCHSYDTSRSQTRKLAKFSYQCDCRIHTLSSIRHNRVLKGQEYICRQCGQVLKALVHD